MPKADSQNYFPAAVLNFTQSWAGEVQLCVDRFQVRSWTQLDNHNLGATMENNTLAQLQEKYSKLETDYKRERSALEKKIAQTKKLEQANAIAQIRSIMNEFGIEPTDIGAGKKARKISRQVVPVAAKYRGANGETWSGRGRQPRWLGDDRQKFLIKD